MNAKINIIYGDKNQGKTTLVKKLIKDALAEGKVVVGFYSEKVLVKNSLIGYNLVTIPQGDVFPFLRNNVESPKKIGVFYINEGTVAIGLSQLEMAINNKVDIVVLDEVGKLELNDKGWAFGIEELLRLFHGKIIMNVRTQFLEQVIQKWNINVFHAISVKNNN